jgi:broad-specificity NMP kinase
MAAGEQSGPAAKLVDPIPIIEVVKVVGHKAKRSDHLAERMRRRNYPVEKIAGKNHCQRADAAGLFPRHREFIEKI